MRSLILALAVLVTVHTSVTTAQDPVGTLRVQVRAAEKPIEGADVVVAGTTHCTDASGTTTVTIVPGTVEVTVAKPGFAPATASVRVVGEGRNVNGGLRVRF